MWRDDTTERRAAISNAETGEHIELFELTKLTRISLESAHRVALETADELNRTEASR